MVRLVPRDGRSPRMSDILAFPEGIPDLRIGPPRDRALDNLKSPTLGRLQNRSAGDCSRQSLQSENVHVRECRQSDSLRAMQSALTQRLSQRRPTPRVIRKELCSRCQYSYCTIFSVEGCVTHRETQLVLIAAGLDRPGPASSAVCSRGIAVSFESARHSRRSTIRLPARAGCSELAH
jgi:hypothetical protein